MRHIFFVVAPAILVSQTTAQADETRGLKPIDDVTTTPMETTTPSGVWQVDGEHSCRGMETVWGSCPGLPDCVPCTPMNCTFSAWGEWNDLKATGDCFGLCRRYRKIAQPNNDCGNPCKGTLEETKQCEKPKHCPMLDEDCVIGDWKEWEGCKGKGNNHLQQNTRYREVTHPALFNGKACNGTLSETKDCGIPDIAPCAFNEWESWTACSLRCGGGRRTRLRNYATRSIGMGKQCSGSTYEEDTCNNKTCLDKAPCQHGPWSDWKGCDSYSRYDKKRVRAIAHVATSMGAGCNFTLVEVQPCTYIPYDCNLTTWSPWSTCTKTCHGGQTTRTRQLANDAQHGGQCLHTEMTQLRVCNDSPCSPCAKTDCSISVWTPWSACSVTCDLGYKTRSRNTTNAQAGGTGCTASPCDPDIIKEVKPCAINLCPAQECVYSVWKDWSVCDATCNGGMKHRSRNLIEYAKNGGPCPPRNEGEMTKCNVQPCEVCTDGTWADWLPWSPCTATCGSAYRSRKRVAGLPPNNCGKPAAGYSKEYQACTRDEIGLLSCPKAVCTLAPWEAWSTCGSTCDGLKSRKRAVVSTHDVADSCKQHSLAESAPCYNASMPKQELEKACFGFHPDKSCVWGIWSNWTLCSVSCGRGVIERFRQITQPALGKGAGCTGPMKEVGSCYNQACPRNDIKSCSLTAWSEWSPCLKHGWPNVHSMQTRNRTVNGTKNPCKDERILKPLGFQVHMVCPLGTQLEQTRPCVPLGGGTTSLTYCEWSGWTAWSACPASCNATRNRVRIQSGSLRPCRSLKPVNSNGTTERQKLYESIFDERCTRNQTQTNLSCNPEACKEVCNPKDLVVGAWSEWLHNETTQLCQRSRPKTQDKNKCGSYETNSPCKTGNKTRNMLGKIVETKACPTYFPTCHLGPLIPIPPLNCTKKEDERPKSRALPLGWPHKCTGFTTPDSNKDEVTLLSKMGCVDALFPPKNCVMGPWGPWSGCGRILKPLSPGSASPCKNDTQQMHINPKCQTTSTRMRQFTPPANGGLPCTNSTQEVKECSTIQHNATCAFTLWSDWSGNNNPCKDSTKQQMVRTRKVLAAVNGWTGACIGKLAEMKPAASPAPECNVGEWTVWSSCSVSCGRANKRRSREAALTCTKKYNETILEEVAPCDMPLCPGDIAKLMPVDCRLSDWGMWSECVKACKTCDTGTKSRVRGLQNPTQAHGKGCQNATKEYQLCTLPPVGPKVVDCQKAAWTNWTICTKSCGGGVQKRSQPLNTRPTVGGKPCEKGLNSTQIRPCNVNKCPDARIDAEWGEWVIEGACSSTCRGGYVKRTRTVVRKAENGGSEAIGLAEQAQECNVGIPCNAGDITVNCSFGLWSPWSPCGNWHHADRALKPVPSGKHVSRSEKCTGVQTRTRSYSPGKLGGLSCNGPLEQTQICNKCGPGPCAPTCAFSEWTAWSVCPVSCGGGQIERTRTSQNPDIPTCNGTLKETMPCNTNSCAGPQSDCQLAGWGPWSICDHCGGLRKRSRAIIQFGLPDGKNCKDASLLQVDKCTSHCGIKFCTWSAWAEWTECSTTCGYGKRYKTRTLGLVEKAPQIAGKWIDESTIEDKMHQLYRKQQSLEARRNGERLVAFSLGAIAFLALLAVGRFKNRSESRRNTRVISRDNEESLSVSVNEVRGDVVPSRHGYKGVPLLGGASEEQEEEEEEELI